MPVAWEKCKSQKKRLQRTVPSQANNFPDQTKKGYQKMVTKKQLSEIQELVRKISTVEPNMRGMVASMCPADIIKDIAEAEKIKDIYFETRPATSPDENEYWTAQSPFDNMWYTFTARYRAPRPTKAFSVTPSKPEIFD